MRDGVAEETTRKRGLAASTSVSPPHPRQNEIGPCPMHEVVVMAVRKAVRAATITFTAISMNPFFLIVLSS